MQLKDTSAIQDEIRDVLLHTLFNLSYLCLSVCQFLPFLEQY